MNKAVLIGRLGGDPDVRTLTTGRVVATFSLAVKRTFREKGGDYATDWLPVVVWGRQAENAGKYLHKGSRVAVTGRIAVRSYENREGNLVKVTEIVADDIEYLEPKETTETQETAPGGFYEVQEGMPF